MWLIKEVRVYLRTYIAYISRRSHHFYISQTHWREESASGSFDVAANSVCWTVWVCCGISRSSYLPLSLSLSLTSCSTVTASYSARRSANDHPSRTNLRSDDANDSGLAQTRIHMSTNSRTHINLPTCGMWNHSCATTRGRHQPSS